MLKLCPLFLEGANLYIQIIALLCCVQHHNFITNLKPGLGTYWEIYTSRLHGLYLSHHVRTLSSGLAPSMHGTRYFTVRDWDTGTIHNLRTRLPAYLGHYAQKVSIIPSMLSGTHYSQNYAGIICPTLLSTSSSCAKLKVQFSMQQKMLEECALSLTFMWEGSRRSCGYTSAGRSYYNLGASLNRVATFEQQYKV